MRVSRINSSDIYDSITSREILQPIFGKMHKTDGELHMTSLKNSYEKKRIGFQKENIGEE